MDPSVTSDATPMSEAVMSAAVDEFCSITGATASVARTALESCNWNLELAINMFVDQNDLQMDSGVSRAPANRNPSTPQESNTFDSLQEDNIRPPIPPVRQVLVDDYPGSSYGGPTLRRPNSNSVFDAFRDFEQEARWHEQQMETDANNPSNSSTDNKRRTLEDLFRPPLDLMFRGTLDMAKDEGQRLNKWLMVNIQNHREFSCQVLNRDVWSNPTVKSVVTEHFIFWQSYHDNSEGQRFMQFYNVTDFPYVAILDPRTGEKLRQWTTIDPVSFCDLVTEFLHDLPSPSGSPANVHNSNSNSTLVRKSSDEKALYEESEEMQIKAAIAASLKEVSKGEVHSNNHTVNDVDDSDFETFDSDNEDFRAQSNASKTNASSSALNTKESSLSDNSSQESKPKEEEEVIEDYKLYLGPQNGSKFEFVVRYPDGNRENVIFPSDSQLKALFLYLSSKGYNMKDYDLITNFPKRNLKEFFTNDSNGTLESAGIHSRDTLYVQHKT
ncbi:unnamed protein product [Medioppia subpectinata]|uniref:UBX domain-containing protein n=1 Tax=Medioppia subpectinata TaxID=1979941 RepID=A0A7R9KIX3_9ACAR|nr:unnamed protein product [Medioppia subpectinata]CAG2104107.1 unnamed protein product [Medioppia subpectinata]